MEDNWHVTTIAGAIDKLNSSERGLSQEQANRRLQEWGINKISEAKVDSLTVIFLRQFQSPLIYILLAASIIIFVMGEIIDGSIILAVLVFNSIVGTIQEGKAQNTLAALKKFVETKATVLRDGKELIISDEQVVPGDIIVLQEGEKVAADARVIVSQNLKVDEATLTGESEPVHKVNDALEKTELPIQDQKNMIFKGTHIVSGNGKALVVAIGIKTAVGKIAKEIAAIDTEIPLRLNIRYLSRLIIITVASIDALLFLLGIASGRSMKEMFITTVALSISLIPEGLPIVITLVLATGVWRMGKRNALVKKLQAVEALGQARVIAVDKTGTITKNEIVIQKVYLPADKTGDNGKVFEVSGIGYGSSGEIRLEKNIIDPLNHPEILFAGKIAAFCANARVMFSEEEKAWQIAGDPTEAAMLVFAQKLGFHKGDLERESPLVGEIPFDYKLKYHATLHKTDGQNFLAVVGAPEVILNLCHKVWRNGKIHDLSENERKDLEDIFLSLSHEGLRVVALAVLEGMSQLLTPEKIHSLTFVGFFGMKDALRPEVQDAVLEASSAGIKVVMITGDHKVTARAIAKEAGIYRPNDIILTGHDIDMLSDSELKKMLAKTSIFARVTPEHKLRIIKAYKSRGEIVAMTGDGVNDAPSLVAADLGVAMGRIGTEVAKEASDIVLLDDNFKSIISAVKEGRSIYKTIKKVILYLFSTSLGEVFTIAGALFLAYPLPILAGQIIWLNFVTDGFLDVAIAMEPKEEGLLRGNFERPKKYLIDKLMVQRMFVMAIPMMIGTLFLFKGYFEDDLTKAWTISLTTLAVFQWFNAWNCRHESKSIFQINPLSNKFLAGATLIVIFLQVLAIYNPFMQTVLRTTPLKLSEWLIIIPIAASVILVEEVRKLLYRRRQRLALF